MEITFFIRCIMSYNATVKHEETDSEILNESMKEIIEVEKELDLTTTCGYKCIGCGGCDSYILSKTEYPSSNKITFTPCIDCYNCGKCERLGYIDIEDS